MGKTSIIDQPLILHYSIITDPDLRKLELQGFVKGAAEGKTMNVPLHRMILKSLHKQYLDFCKAYGDSNNEEMMRCLADLRNVAGCCFLKLKETTEK